LFRVVISSYEVLNFASSSDMLDSAHLESSLSNLWSNRAEIIVRIGDGVHGVRAGLLNTDWQLSGFLVLHEDVVLMHLLRRVGLHGL
jgi:hypothetical protein